MKGIVALLLITLLSKDSSLRHLYYKTYPREFKGKERIGCPIAFPSGKEEAKVFWMGNSLFFNYKNQALCLAHFTKREIYNIKQGVGMKPQMPFISHLLLHPELVKLYEDEDTVIFVVKMLCFSGQSMLSSDYLFTSVRYDKKKQLLTGEKIPLRTLEMSTDSERMKIVLLDGKICSLGIEEGTFRIPPNRSGGFYFTHPWQIVFSEDGENRLQVSTIVQSEKSADYFERTILSLSLDLKYDASFGEIVIYDCDFYTREEMESTTAD